MNEVIGFTCGAFDLFHAGHQAMMMEAKKHCTQLIVGLQTDPTIDRTYKNKPIQSLFERQMALRSCKYVDEVMIYETEADLTVMLHTLPIDIRFVDEEYRDKPFTGDCNDHTMPYRIHYNLRRHKFSTSALRDEVLIAQAELAAKGKSTA